MKTIGRIWTAIFNLANVICDWTDEVKLESDMARHSINADRGERLKQLGIKRDKQGNLTFPEIA